MKLHLRKKWVNNKKVHSRSDRMNVDGHTITSVIVSLVLYLIFREM